MTKLHKLFIIVMLLLSILSILSFVAHFASMNYRLDTLEAKVGEAFRL